jgi:hypothetical protein
MADANRKPNMRLVKDMQSSFFSPYTVGGRRRTPKTILHHFEAAVNIDKKVRSGKEKGEPAK